MSAGSLFNQANAALRTNRYKEAQKLYQQSLQEQGEIGAIHYNLATAYYRDGQVGHSIYHFRKATQLNPRDGDAQFNLNYVRKATKDKIEIKSSAFESMINSNYPLNLKESSYFFATSVVLATVLGIIVLFKKSEILTWLQRVALVVVVVAALATGYRYFATENIGVVTVAEAKVYSGMGRKNILLFKLHEGAEFVVDQVETEWLRIKLADGKKGWVSVGDTVY